MSDVFICYARQDREFVQRLLAELNSRGVETWIDWAEIQASADWWSEIRRGIEDADSFIFVISLDSIHSEVCRREIDYAVDINKRFIPLLYSEIHDSVERANIHPVIISHNWIYFRDSDDFDSSFNTLIEAINTDLEHVRRHTHYLSSARRWDARGRNPDNLLRGGELQEAIIWLSEAEYKSPQATELHRQYIQESQLEAAKYEQPLRQIYRAAVKRVFGLGPRKVFISYRRADSADVCGRIYDRLEPAFGRKNLFLDVDSIDYGSDFSQFIQRTLTECFAVLVVIGPQWVTLLKERAAKSEADFVKIEVETALKRQQLNTIPLFVSGAQPPDADDLPETMRGLALKNGTPIRAGRDFHRDMDGLIKELKKLRAQAKQDGQPS